MTKAEFRNDLVSKGYTVQPVAEWLLVSNVDGVVKYDLNFEKDGTFATGQIKVTDDGAAGESVTGLGALDLSETFTDRVKALVASKEGTGGVKKVVITDVKEAFGVAEATVYLLSNTDVTKVNYVVIEEAGVLNFYKLI